jgi:acetoacetyl-CoA synthetase
MSTSLEGTLLWEPTPEMQQRSVIRAYMEWLERTKGLRFTDYPSLWEWSSTQIEDFWESVWEFYDIQASQPYERVLSSREMPGAEWFPGARLNFAEHVFRNASAERPAILFQSEREPLREISWAELRRQVAAVAAALRERGVQPGDRVVGYIPNIPEAVVVFLACASLGAVWSSCSPDFGEPSVVDRFKQIEPRIMIAIDGYAYGGKSFDRRETVARLQHDLPSLELTVLLPYLDADASTAGLSNAILWRDLLAHDDAELHFEQVSFSHPLWVLYSSGTTGLPKPIVQGHGGILLEHLKSINLQFDLRAGDRLFWYTTTGWMMWNFLVGGLLVGCTILVYDGSPGWPDLNVLWKFAEDTRMTYFGTSAGFLTACMKADLSPGSTFDLGPLRGIGSTASPLPPEAFVWVYENVKRDVMLISFSGGTDVCTGFVGGTTLLPIYAGEIQCRHLGCRVEAFDEEGNSVIDQVGEFVVTQPMPSMPLYFWDDPQNHRYLESYFSMYPSVWRHGDWVKITPRGGAVISGRSDATINRQGIRMGTSDIYRAAEDVEEVKDSLVMDVDIPGKASYMPLFVVLREGATLDEALVKKIKGKIREILSPRHVPDDVFAVPDVPRTLSGKKLEIPVKKIFMGTPVEKAANLDSMSNPQVLHVYADLAQQINPTGRSK